MSSHPATEPETSRAHLFAGIQHPSAQPAARPPVAPALAPPDGPEVDLARCVEPGTRAAVVLTFIGAVIGLAFLAATITGGIIVAVLWLAQIFAARRARILLRASALRVGPRQFPQIHGCSSFFARRLSLAEVPEIYVVDAAEVNGFTLRFGRRNGIVLTDETVAASLEGKSPGALAFVIAHEMGHIALGHHRWWRSPLRRFRLLSRLDEFSADSVACELVGSLEPAEEGILLLVAGPRLLSFVDRPSARTQAAEVAADRPTKRAERLLSHPVTLRRLDRVVKRFASRRERVPEGGGLEERSRAS